MYTKCITVRVRDHLQNKLIDGGYALLLKQMLRFELPKSFQTVHGSAALSFCKRDAHLHK